MKPSTRQISFAQPHCLIRFSALQISVHQYENTCCLNPPSIPAFAACDRKSDNAEVQRLREEVERLKAVQAAATPTATPTPISTVGSQDYQNFIHAARRLITAIETGISFQDFHERVTDVLASAKEASRSAPSSDKQKKVETFALGISDAHEIWRYKVARSKYELQYSKLGDSMVRMEDPCSERWDFKYAELVSTYTLDKDEPGYLKATFERGSNPYVSIDFAIKKIFKVCAETFESLDP